MTRPVLVPDGPVCARSQVPHGTPASGPGHAGLLHSPSRLVGLRFCPAGSCCSPETKEGTPRAHSPCSHSALEVRTRRDSQWGRWQELAISPGVWGEGKAKPTQQVGLELGGPHSIPAPNLCRMWVTLFLALRTAWGNGERVQSSAVPGRGARPPCHSQPQLCIHLWRSDAVRAQGEAEGARGAGAQHREKTSGSEMLGL